MQYKSLYLFRHITWYKHNATKKFKGATYNKYSFPRKLPPHFNTEHILIFYKNFSNTISKTKAKIHSKEFLDRIDNDFHHEFRSSIWSIPTLNYDKKVDDDSKHPAPFPEDIPFRLIKLFTFKDEIVLDPFMGKGTSLKMALLTGRNAIGYELNPSYIDIFLKKYIYSDITSCDYKNFYKKEYERSSTPHSVNFNRYFKNQHARDIANLNFAYINILL